MPQQAKKVWQGQIFSAWQWPQKQYDGSMRVYERLKRKDVAHVVGVLADGRILLTEDEQPDRQVVITPPGGSVEEGENPKEAAVREMLEETGYAPEELILWHSYYPSGKIDWQVYSYIGRGVKKVAEPQPEAGERIKLLQFSFDEFLALGTNPKMRDMVIRIILLEAQLNKTKRQELENILYGQ